MEAIDRHGQTPLNLAARHGYADVVRVLLAAGAKADHADCDGWTALRAAAWGGHTQVDTLYIYIGSTNEFPLFDNRWPHQKVRLKLSDVKCSIVSLETT